MAEREGWKKWATGVLDVIFPRDCLLTGEPVGDDSEWLYFKRLSRREMGIVEPPHCPTCGAPFWGEMQLSRICTHCLELEPEFGEGRTCLVLQGAGRSIIHELKYHQGWHLLPDIRRVIQVTPRFLEFLKGAVIVPVPLHPRKERERGFNQTEILARLFVEEAEDARFSNALCRVRDTMSQTRLNHQSRQNNMKGAFQARPDFTPIKGKRYVVVDDVFTTGATLNACCEALKDAGVFQVDIATLGHG